MMGGKLMSMFPGIACEFCINLFPINWWGVTRGLACHVWLSATWINGSRGPVSRDIWSRGIWSRLVLSRDVYITTLCIVMFPRLHTWLLADLWDWRATQSREFFQAEQIISESKKIPWRHFLADCHVWPGLAECFVADCRVRNYLWNCCERMISECKMSMLRQWGYAYFVTSLFCLCFSVRVDSFVSFQQSSLIVHNLLVLTVLTLIKYRI